MMERKDIVEMHQRQHHLWLITLVLLTVGLVLSIFVTIMIGAVDIPPSRVFEALFSSDLIKVLNLEHASNPINAIILEIRLPRILMAGLVGAALAVAGTAMQGIFRNPMASPYLLGLSSGAAFGASLAIAFGFSVVAGDLAVPMMAFIFCFLTLFMVYGISRTKMGVPVTTLLLAGIALGALFTSLVSLVKFFSGDNLSSIVYWTMGFLWGVNWTQVYLVLPIIMIGCLILLMLGRELNLLMVGEEQASNLGVNVKLTRFIIIFASALVTAAAVSVTGIIGFVGLIVPHIMRMIIGPNNRILLPASILGGAIFMIWMDTLARTVMAPTELPVGIITALVGVPFFLYLLRTRKRDIWGG